jgi:hypothetical protein
VKLVNKTDWDSRQVKAFVRAVALKEELAPEDVAKLAVTLEYRRRSSRRDDGDAAGRGAYGDWRFSLSVVKGVEPDKVKVARTVAVMLGFNQGLRSRHVRMSSYYYGTDWRQRWEWAAEMPLGPKQAKVEEPLAPDEAVNEDIRHCLEQVVAWEQKAKLAKTKLATWNRKLRYYTRKLGKVIPGPEKAAGVVEELI